MRAGAKPALFHFPYRRRPVSSHLPPSDCHCEPAEAISGWCGNIYSQMSFPRTLESIKQRADWISRLLMSICIIASNHATMIGIVTSPTSGSTVHTGESRYPVPKSTQPSLRALRSNLRVGWQLRLSTRGTVVPACLFVINYLKLPCYVKIDCRRNLPLQSWRVVV